MEGLAGLLGEDPRLAPDIYFRVIEEVIVNGISEKRSELVGAHKFVLAMLSDVFKTMFFGPMRDQNDEIEIIGTTFEAFKEFLKILYSLHTSSCETSVVEVKPLFEILDLCKRYMVQPAVTLIEEKILSADLETITLESVIAAVRVANKYKELVGFETISEKLLQYCSASLNKGLTTVHQVRYFLGQVNARFPEEIVSLVVGLLALTDCSNCKAPKCLDGCQVTRDNIARAKDPRVRVANYVSRDHDGENEAELVGEIDSIYFGKWAGEIPHVYIKWDEFLYGGDVFDLDSDAIYFKCKGASSSTLQPVQGFPPRANLSPLCIQRMWRL